MFNQLYTFDTDFQVQVYGPFKDEDVERIEYYMTSPDKEKPGCLGWVKIGKKLTLKSGEQYGTVFEIPFNELKRLISQHDEVNKA